MLLAIGLVAGATVFIVGLARHRIVVPEAVLLEDFQRPTDRDLTEGLMALENGHIIQSLESGILKPYYDDVQTAFHDVAGIEVTGGALPERPHLGQAIRECATVLHMTCPRVYLVSDRELNACAGNLTDPVILVNSEILETFTDPAELRFIIGHEMGHIRAGHVKLLVALSAIASAIRAHALLPDVIAEAPLLLFLKWAREAEMSADAAGLICCQDLAVAEQALARLAHGSKREGVGRVDIQSFLAQSERRKVSTFAEIRRYEEELQRGHPFVPERIRALRDYSESRQYRHLFE
jgi:Zn-dependent protease with chaperone function